MQCIEICSPKCGNDEYPSILHSSRNKSYNKLITENSQ